MRKLSLMIVPLLLLTPSQAEAYIDPGVGTGTIAVVLVVAVAIVLAFIAILWYPVKSLIKGRKS